jgi:hypothetical protein
MAMGTMYGQLNNIWSSNKQGKGTGSKAPNQSAGDLKNLS